MASARSSALLGQALYTEAYGGNLAPLEALVRVGYEEAAQAGDLQSQMMMLTSLGDIHLWRGQYASGIEEYSRFREWAFSEAMAGQVIGAQFFLGMLHGNLGQFAMARVVLEEGQRLAESSSERFWMVRIPNTIAWLNYEAFDFAGALELNRAAKEQVHPTGLLEPEANTVINLGLCAMELGELDLARTSFEEAQSLFERDDWMRWRYHQRLQLAWSELHGRLGDIGTAIRHANRCLELTENTSRGKHRVLAYRRLGLLSLQAGRREDARLYLESASEELARTDSVLAAWRIHDAWSQFWQAEGDSAAVADHSRKALRILNTIASNSPDDLQHSILTSETVARLRKIAEGHAQPE
jgi:tetratricopeptide (TPR) repeat protein